MKTILVTGGTGTLGRHLTPLLLDAGHRVRVLSRSGPGPASRDGTGPRDGLEYVTGDLSTGEGAEAAVDGADTIVHCAGSTKGDEEKARNLVRAAAAGAGNPHLVYISVVGADRVPVVSAVDRAMFGYFAQKLAAERVIAGSGLPWTTLRATQFHEFVVQLVRPMAKMPVVPSFAGVRFQPVDARDVAARLAELALGEPSGLVADLGGPRIYDMKDMVRDYLRAVGRGRRPVVPVRAPGKAFRAYQDGANLAPDHATGKGTWEEFLAARFG